MDQLSQSQVSEPAGRITKRQRREQRRLENEQQRMRTGQKRRGTAFIWYGAAVAVVALIVWGIIAASKNGATAMFDDANDPFQGGEQATVVLREYSDFQCPACRSVQPLFEAINKEFGDRIKFIFNDYPLTGLHENAYAAAIAGQCAYPQNKFWAFHDKLFQSQQEWGGLDSPGARAKFVTYAKDLGLNEQEFTTCLDGSDAKARVDQDMAEGDRLRVPGTPTLYINDKKQTGGLSVNGLKEQINAALEAAGSSSSNTAAENTNTTAAPAE